MRCDGRRGARPRRAGARTTAALAPSAWVSARRAARLGVAALATSAALAGCGGSADQAVAHATGRPRDAVGGSGAVERAAVAADTATVTVYKSPTCGCCAKWVDHMRANGFRVVVHDTADVAPVRAAHGVTGLLASCHTALVGGYVVEGHVPAADVWQLLRERPPLVGVAVPGMPMGAPGMEGPYPAERFQVYAFDRDGGGGVFAQH